MQSFNLQNKKDIKGIKLQVKLQDQSQENYKKYQAELEKLAANKDELGSVKFKLLQQQEKISAVSTALEQTKQEISALEADYEKEKLTLKLAY